MAFLKKISHNKLTDKELIALYKESGDMTALGELYQRYMELVYGVCLKYFKEPETAKDSVIQVGFKIEKARSGKLPRLVAPGGQKSLPYAVANP